MVGHERGIKANCFTSRLNCVKSLWLDKERERQRGKREEVQRYIKVLLALETRKSVMLQRQGKWIVLNVQREKSECIV